MRIGSTLALTGPLAPAGNIQKVAIETFIEDLNGRGGLLGRKVEWVLKDDQSRPDLARTLYEQLATVDKVDLLMGPYGTASILSAMGVAQRYNKILIHNSFGTPKLAKYDMQFSASGGSGDPEVVWPNLAFDAAASAPKPPKTVAIVTSKFPATHFISLGAREVAKKRGLQEVLFLEWEFGNRDFGPIASRIKDANPDLIFAGALGLDGVLLLDAMKKIDYRPAMHFYTFPRPARCSSSRGEERARAHHLRGAPALHQRRRGGPLRRGIPRARRQGRAAFDLARPAGHDRLLPRGRCSRRRSGREELRRQGARRLAEEKPGGHGHGTPLLARDARRPAQLRHGQGHLQGEAAPGRQVGGGVAQGVRRARGQAAGP